MDVSKYCIFLVFISLFIIGNSIRIPECHQIGFDNCLKSNFFEFGRREDVSNLVTTEQGFDQLCRRFNISIDECISIHLKRCAPPMYYPLFQLITEEMQVHFREYICDRSNNQRGDYFKYAECYRKFVFANDNAMSCLNNYLLAFEHIERTLGGTTSNQMNFNSTHANAILTWRRVICCAHERKRECTRKLASKHCGPNTAEPFDRFFEQIHFGFFEIVCNVGQTMNPGLKECNDETMPNWQLQPKGLKSNSAVSRLLVTYFPFNYVSLKNRTRIHRLYKQLKAKGIKSNIGSTG